MGNAKDPPELFLRVIAVSLAAMRVVKGLPGLGADTDQKLAPGRSMRCRFP